MRAPLATKLGLAVFVLILIPGASSAQSDFSRTPLPVFEFHSGFWLNLHHTLYYQARQQRTAGATSVLATSSLSPAEQKASDAAVSFYAQTYAGKDLHVPLDFLFIKNHLRAFATAPH